MEISPVEMERLPLLVEELKSEYQTYNGWDRLRSNPRLLLRKARSHILGMGNDVPPRIFDKQPVPKSEMGSPPQDPRPFPPRGRPPFSPRFFLLDHNKQKERG